MVANVWNRSEPIVGRFDSIHQTLQGEEALLLILG
jgi:hypothetical protein